MCLICYLFLLQCQRLEEQGHESVVISLNDDGNFITGSKWGKEFVEDRYIFVTDFMQFCTGDFVFSFWLFSICL